jgi:dolichyl-phosphate-mannose-protein mannosyltransferase
VNLHLNLQINKKDILTMVVLSIVFFSIAVANLGSSVVPQTTWQSDQTQNLPVQVDLGQAVYVNQLYVLFKNGSGTIQVDYGSAPNWTSAGQMSETYPYAYYNWNNTSISAQTRIIRLVFQQANLEIEEIAVVDQNSQKIPIAQVAGENFTDSNLNRLIDEQNLVQMPKTYMTETMFDEVYFTRTAEQYLHFQLPYEWTHPPLGKIIIAVGIAAFGLNPFGWRIMDVVFGTLLVALMYLLGKKLFGSWIGGFSTAFLFMFDFMHFTEARLGQADTFVVFFSVASQLFFLLYLKGVVKDGWKKTSVLPLFLAFLFFALGFSSKWLVLYGFGGEIALLVLIRLNEVRNIKGKFSDRVYAFFDHPYSSIVMFVLIAIGIYFLTYIPDMLAGRSFLEVIGLQGGMYAYHSQPIGLDHPYASAWWSWPIIGKPLWQYISLLPNNMRSTITLMGNPAVWWVGFASIIMLTIITASQAVQAFLKKAKLNLDLPAVFIVAVFFFQWLPYAFISRGLFIYHFYVNVPFLCLGSTYFINKYWHYKLGKIAAAVFFVAVVALFVLFYPVVSGTPVLTSTSESLRWFGGWNF